MFSALSQGSLIHVLEKENNKLKYSVGEVIGVTQPNGSMFGTSSYINSNIPIIIKAKVNDEVREFPDVAPSQNIMSYNNGNIIISESIQGIQTEVETRHKRNKQILANREIYEQEIEDCENIMKEISPQFAKDKERDDRINGLATKVTNMEDKLDKILNAITNNQNK